MRELRDKVDAKEAQLQDARELLARAQVCCFPPPSLSPPLRSPRLSSRVSRGAGTCCVHAAALRLCVGERASLQVSARVHALKPVPTPPQPPSADAYYARVHTQAQEDSRLARRETQLARDQASLPPTPPGRHQMGCTLVLTHGDGLVVAGQGRVGSAARVPFSSR